MPRTVLPGKPYPQGATWDGTGVNFSLYSENAAAVDLCLFDDIHSTDFETVSLREVTGYVWHGYLLCRTFVAQVVGSFSAFAREPAHSTMAGHQQRSSPYRRTSSLTRLEACSFGNCSHKSIGSA
jgi:pullulanase/glycogen debranching enzyme